MGGEAKLRGATLCSRAGVGSPIEHGELLGDPGRTIIAETEQGVGGSMMLRVLQ
jgi:hypothetical protein